MEDQLEPAARLVDFLLGCTLDSRLSMHFPNTKYERAYLLRRIERIAAQCQ